MSTTLKMKIIVPTSGGADRAVTAGPDSARAGGSTSPREFLAMRARQKAAEARVRRLKRASTFLGLALAVGAFAVPRFIHRKQAKAATPVVANVAHTAQPAQTATPAATAVPAASSLLAAEPTPAPVVVAPALEPAVATAEAVAPVDDSPVSRCNDDFARHQWRAAIDSCTRAFKAAPDGAVALTLAHAQWSHGDAAQAGKWAARAVALGNQDPDAYVLVGHSERQAGHPDAAMTAYRRYLRRAPQGWHSDRVRAAIRELKAAAAASAATTTTAASAETATAAN